MIPAIILCGGASRRMGTSKAQLKFNGENLLTRTVRIVNEVCSPIIIAAGPNQPLPDLPANIEIVRDEVEFGGPALALAAAFSRLPTGSEHVFVTGCDYPFLSSRIIEILVQKGRPGSAVIARIDGQAQPMPALYPVVSLEPMKGLKAMHEILAKFPVIEMDEIELKSIDPELESFQSMNTPEEFAAAQRRATMSAIDKQISS